MQEQKIAYIDLSTGEITTGHIPEKIRRKYLGGRGIAAYLLYNHVPEGCDPLGPDNVFIVSAGLIGGTLAPSSGRCDLTAKSPLTSLLGNSNMGGFFAPELRFAGFDHLVIKGKADAPVYLWVHDGQIEIRDASHLWGKDTRETPSIIRKDHQDEEVKVMCIGEAGENLVRFANVITGTKNAAGRTGMGCVMGSKNLKAVAARGTGDVPISNPEAAFEQLQRWSGVIRKRKMFQAFSTVGTPMMHESSNVMGRLRVRNLQSNQDPAGESLYADKLEKLSVGMAACFGCPVHCRHRYVVPEGPYQGTYSEGPEWSTIGALGTELNVGKMEAILVGNHLVNKYGIDSLEFGSMLSWAIELYEKGIIDDTVTGGVKLDWGDEDLMCRMIEQVARREGLGDILADGPLRAIEKLGEETGFYNLHVKGMSLLHTDERATPAMALGVSTSTRGADHLRSRPSVDANSRTPEARDSLFGFATPVDFHAYEGSGKVIHWHELMYTLTDALGVCKFQVLLGGPSTMSSDDYCKLVEYITGMALSLEEMMEAAERIYTLERMFNIREGAGRKDDYPPERYFVEPTPALGLPGFQGKTLDREKYEQQLDEYYQAHGWDNEGIPTPETLETLGLTREPTRII